jgi:hypothetical protein
MSSTCLGCGALWCKAPQGICRAKLRGCLSVHLSLTVWFPEHDAQSMPRLANSIATGIHRSLTPSASAVCAAHATLCCSAPPQQPACTWIMWTVCLSVRLPAGLHKGHVDCLSVGPSACRTAQGACGLSVCWSVCLPACVHTSSSACKRSSISTSAITRAYSMHVANLGWGGEHCSNTQPTPCTSQIWGGVGGIAATLSLSLKHHTPSSVYSRPESPFSVCPGPRCQCGRRAPDLQRPVVQRKRKGPRCGS